jgi:hypothetical protein
MLSNLWFKKTQYILSFVRFYKIWADIVGISDFEELVGVTYRREWGREIIGSR